jgi:hypothetical protein
MKKHWFCILYFLIVFSLFLPPAFAYQIFSDPISGDPGENICVPIHITDIDNPFDIETIAFDVEYNPNHLSYIQLKTDDTLTKDAMTIDYPFENKPAVKVTFSLNDSVTIKEDTILVNICFSIRDNALESESITLTNFQDDIAGANVVIPEFEYRVFSDPFSGKAHDEISVPIQISDIQNAFEVKTFGFIFEYNSDNLEFNGTKEADTLTHDFAIHFDQLDIGFMYIGGKTSNEPIRITEDSILINIDFSILENTLESESITLTGFEGDIAKANRKPSIFEYKIFSDPVRGNFNEEQCVPIRITDIKNSLEIHQFGFDVTYNRHNLNYIRFNTAESLSKDYTIETSVNEETSQVTFDGTASSIPIAITEDTILINTCFKLEKALESEPITLTGFREDIDRANIDYSNLPSSYLSQNISNEDSDIGECFIQLITVDFSVFFGNPKNCLKRSSPR